MRMFLRFSRRDRAEHWTIVALFLGLVLTGLPQRFYEGGWARAIMTTCGGIDGTRLGHRRLGILFFIVVLWHLLSRTIAFLRRRAAPSMLIGWHDFRDAIQNLRYYLGVSEHEARCDRFDYKQKFEYWGMVMGSVVMVLTGWILYAPAWWTQWLPGELVPAAKVAHSNEAMLALLVVVVWHLYGCIFSPEVFPLDTSMFTGRISETRLRREHPLEYERLATTAAPIESPPPA